MDIKEAWDILKSYYTMKRLIELCVNQKIDNTEQDDIKRYRFFASLLCEKEKFAVTEKRKRELLEAAQAFEDEAAKEFYNI